jgi:hypothetical protein
MAIPMIEVMRANILEPAEGYTAAKSNFYSAGGKDRDLLQKMDAAEVRVMAALDALTPEEVIELVRRP